MPAPLTRIFSWMFPALGLIGERTPSTLADGDVCPVLDVFGDGWRLGSTIAITFTKAASVAAAYLPIITGDPNRTRRLIGISLLHGGGAGNATVQLQWVATNLDSAGVTLVSKSLPIDTILPSTDILSSPIILPPNYGLSWYLPATAVGETFGGRAVFWDMPAGSRPI